MTDFQNVLYYLNVFEKVAIINNAYFIIFPNAMYD